MGRGLDLTVEFIAAIFTWGGIGWLVDQWLGWSPWAMVVGFLLGNACGLYLMWLRGQQDDITEQAAKAADGTVQAQDGRQQG